MPGNYLRARGEYCAPPAVDDNIMELPPRTRRILDGGDSQPRRFGTTSAHAENTPTTARERKIAWNYLRARGEYCSFHGHLFPHRELPPRTRRIRLSTLYHYVQDGTTSAHAENTKNPGTTRLGGWNYLRARGEYSSSSFCCAAWAELPPRTRRIHSHDDHFDEILGTTSAHAENTR